MKIYDKKNIKLRKRSKNTQTLEKNNKHNHTSIGYITTPNLLKLIQNNGVNVGKNT